MEQSTITNYQTKELCWTSSLWVSVITHPRWKRLVFNPQLWRVLLRSSLLSRLEQNMFLGYDNCGMVSIVSLLTIYFSAQTSSRPKLHWPYCWKPAWTSTAASNSMVRNGCVRNVFDFSVKFSTDYLGQGFRNLIRFDSMPTENFPHRITSDG